MSDPMLLEAGDGDRGHLAWTLARGMCAISSAPVGGGLCRPNWVVNIGVPLHYARTDLDTHVAEVAARTGLAGSGIGLLTAASVDRVRRGRSDGVVADATVGISKPTWAADPSGGWNEWRSGTINVVVQLPVALDGAAAVNAVMTSTEAKTQALLEAGVPGTGTASDAIVIVWPGHAPVAAFAGPRSQWGSRIALATHAAVAAGIQAAQS